MYIDYEKIGEILGFGKQFFYERKVASNCAYIKKNIKRVKKRLKNKFPLKVVFYVYDSSRWKSQSLYDLMTQDERFEPLIVVTKNAAPENNMNYQMQEDIKKNYEFFKSRRMNVELGYDMEKDEFIPFEKFEPDLIFYSHPWYVETSQGPVVCSKFALTYYVPYYISDTEEFFEYDLRFHRYIHRSYVPDEIIKNFYAPKMPDKGAKLRVVGHPQLDYYYLDKKEHQEKYVIYAPHWTVCGKNIRYGTFDWNGFEILEFAEKHPELNWVFKPHPALYRFLFTSGYMSQKEADEYYARWEKTGMVYDTGDYMDLFQDSKLMITDCGSFLIEYFVTGKPCIHLKSEAFKGNDFVREICNSYYEASNLEELREFLKDVLLENHDPKKGERNRVLAKLSLKDTYCAQNIIEDLLRDL